MTVVTIALNDLAGIKRTLESLRTQSHREVQHVVVDGGSTDGTAEWARAHPAFNDTLVISEPDHGIYDAMNKGLSKAKGHLVCFLNSGDTYVDDSVLATVASSYKEEGWPWAYGFGQIITPTGERSARGRTRERHSWIRNTFWDYVICHPAVFMPPRLVDELGGLDTSLRIAADYKLTMAAGRHAAPRVFPQVMANQLEGGISDARPARSLLETHEVRVELLDMSRTLACLDRAWTAVLITRSVSRRQAGRLARRLRSAVATPVRP